MYGCESWTLKKAECRSIDAFEVWCWRRLLRVPCTTRRSNQSILKKINPGISLEGMKLKLIPLATSCEDLTHWKRLWCWEGLGAGEDGDDWRWDGWIPLLTRWTWVWVNSGSWWWTGGAWRAAIHGVTKSWTWLSDGAELKWWSLHFSLTTVIFFSVSYFSTSMDRAD